MPSTKQIPDGIEVPEGWVCEVHTRRCDAVVWFSPSVVSVFTGYESRHELVDTVGDEINTIPSSYIPYGTVDFQSKLFVFSAFWSEKAYHWAIEIDLGAKTEIAGHVSKVSAKRKITKLEPIH